MVPMRTFVFSRIVVSFVDEGRAEKHTAARQQKREHRGSFRGVTGHGRPY